MDTYKSTLYLLSYLPSFVPIAFIVGTAHLLLSFIYCMSNGSTLRQKEPKLKTDPNHGYVGHSASDIVTPR